MNRVLVRLSVLLLCAGTLRADIADPEIVGVPIHVALAGGALLAVLGAGIWMKRRGAPSGS